MTVRINLRRALASKFSGKKKEKGKEKNERTTEKPGGKNYERKRHGSSQPRETAHHPGAERTRPHSPPLWRGVTAPPRHVTADNTATRRKRRVWRGKLRSTKTQESECPAETLSQSVPRKMAPKCSGKTIQPLEFHAQPDVRAAEAEPQTGKIGKVTAPLTFLGNYLK